MHAQATHVLYLGATIGSEQMQFQASNALYRSSLARGRRGQIVSMLTGRSRCLLKLADIEAHLEVHYRRDAGVQTVPMNRIRGSGDRAHDFDRDFHPLQYHTRSRWQGIALARQQGVALPPVDLIQIGDIYFVLDGHHRISVARAWGQNDIEARVTAWQVQEPLPWEATANTPSHWSASQPVGVARVATAARRASAQLGERFRPSLQGLLNTVGIALRRLNGGEVEEKATLGSVSV